jgi:dihydrofolate synthase / folylpolyglutamate synthase
VIEPVLRELYARGSRGIRLGLDAMREACVRLGHPERAFECVHVAGTNGKGSTCAMLESIARHAGKRVGLYTSPHLCRFAERIQVNGEPVSDDVLASVLRRALDAGPDLTFFEVATLAGFLAFRDAGVELAVLEVGLGGRLDATNVVARPLVTAITSIGFDHMNLLGNTLAEIAIEKAGIAKAGVPMVLGPLGAEARRAVETHAQALNTPLIDGTTEVPALEAGALTAPYQRSNRLVAAHVARRAGFLESAIRLGIREARWPGRFEAIQQGSTTWILEGAHNLDGVDALLASLPPASKGDEPVLVFGALADKRWQPMLDKLATRFATRVYAEPKGRAATPHASLSVRVPGAGFVHVRDALAYARTLAPHVLVTGSLYLVGEARADLLGLPMDPPIAL